MSIDISNLRVTIIPKSDQLNAEQLLAGPITITVTDVRVGGGEDQPVSIHYENDAGRPYKPCKTMRKVLILGWGEDGRKWPGKSMTLYNDPSVRFGGMDVGGIRISHMTDIEKDMAVSLTATKGKKALYTIKKMQAQRIPTHLQAIEQAQNLESLVHLFGVAFRSTKSESARAEFKAAYDMRRADLVVSDPDAHVLSDEAETMPQNDGRELVFAALHKRDTELAGD